MLVEALFMAIITPCFIKNFIYLKKGSWHTPYENHFIYIYLYKETKIHVYFLNYPNTHLSVLSHV